MKPQPDFAASLPHRHTARVRERMVRRQTLPVPRASLVIPDPRIEREIELRQE